jgi:Ion channel
MLKLISHFKSKIASYNVTFLTGLLFAQAIAWSFFLSINRGALNSPVSVAALLSVGVVAILLTTGLALLGHVVTWHLACSLVNTFTLLVVYFSILYWSFGTRGNFNTILSRIDAIYFSLGTLTTAGTGSLTAQSQIARGLVSVQMLLGFTFVAVTFAIAVARLGERSLKNARKTTVTSAHPRASQAASDLDTHKSPPSTKRPSKQPVAPPPPSE